MELKKTALGIELGSTRIKAVLLDETHTPIATGSFDWENRLVNGIWTYDLETVHIGVRACFADLAQDVEAKFGQKLTTVGAMGISGMMHGYLALDKNGVPLAEFRTWRNTITGQAAGILSKEFGFNVPQRWSISHLYQAILNGEEHVARLDHLTSLCSYIHRKLTGLRVVGAAGVRRLTCRVLAKVALMPGCSAATTGVAARSATMSITGTRAIRSSRSISRWPAPWEVPGQWYSAASRLTSLASIARVISWISWWMLRAQPPR